MGLLPWDTLTVTSGSVLSPLPAVPFHSWETSGWCSLVSTSVHTSLVSTHTQVALWTFFTFWVVGSVVVVADVLCKNRPLLKKNNINNSVFFSCARASRAYKKSCLPLSIAKQYLILSSLSSATLCWHSRWRDIFYTSAHGHIFKVVQTENSFNNFKKTLRYSFTVSFYTFFDWSLCLYLWCLFSSTLSSFQQSLDSEQNQTSASFEPFSSGPGYISIHCTT